MTSPDVWSQLAHDVEDLSVPNVGWSDPSWLSLDEPFVLTASLAVVVPNVSVA
jgi:hypothetical protein